MGSGCVLMLRSVEFTDRLHAGWGRRIKKDCKDLASEKLKLILTVLLPASGPLHLFFPQPEIPSS